MPEWCDMLLVLLLVTGPYILVGFIAFWVAGLRSHFLDIRLSIGHLLSRLAHLTITPREILIFLSWVLPLYWLRVFGFVVPVLPVVAVLVGLWLWRKWKARQRVPALTGEVLMTLDALRSRIQETDTHVQLLAQHIRTKQDEVAAQDRIAADLARKVADLTEKLRNWSALDPAKRQEIIEEILAYTRAPRKRSTMDRLGDWLLAIVLALVASYIFLVFGPGRKQEALDQLHRLREWLGF
jgi:hypothetical protein